MVFIHTVHCAPAKPRALTPTRPRVRVPALSVLAPGCVRRRGCTRTPSCAPPGKGGGGNCAGRIHFFLSNRVYLDVRRLVTVSGVESKTKSAAASEGAPAAKNSPTVGGLQ